MRRILFTALLILGICTASFSREFIAAGETHTALGSYKIEKADNPVIMNGVQLKTYIISYQNSPMEVTLLIRQDKKCKSYLTLSDKLSVQYVCNGDYFGIQRLDQSFNGDKYSTSDNALNRTEYFRQKLLVWGKQDEIACAKLIAAYFPMLIKQESIAMK